MRHERDGCGGVAQGDGEAGCGGVVVTRDGWLQGDGGKLVEVGQVVVEGRGWGGGDCVGGVAAPPVEVGREEFAGGVLQIELDGS